jgi:hypothetical protein
MGWPRLRRPLRFSALVVGAVFQSGWGWQEDTATVYYCLSESANLDITVANAAGVMVRTLEDGVSHNGSAGCAGWNNRA